MKINRTELLDALAIVKPGLANIELIEQSTSFAFFGDKVVTYNDELSISHPITGLDITGAVRAEELFQLLSRIKQEEVSIQTTENELKIKAGNSLAALTLAAEITLPLEEVEAEKGWRTLPEEFTDNLMFVKDSASRDMSRRVLTCVHVTKQYMECSDSFQLIRLYQAGWPFGDFLIPAETVVEIHKLEPSEVAESNGWLHFRQEKGRTELSVRILEDTYPDASEHLVVSGHELTFPKNMPEILDRVMVFTKKDHSMDEEMEVNLTKGSVIVSGSNDYGRFKEKAKASYKGKGGKFWITPSLLQSILKRSNVCTLGKDKIRFDGNGWEYIAALKEPKS